MRTSILMIVIVLFCSCKKELNTKKYFYPSGNLKQISFYNSNNRIDSLKSYYDSIEEVNYITSIRKKDYDSIIFYYKNGNVFKTGKQTFEGLKFGNWNRYTKESVKSDVREYFIIKGKSLINRRFYLNKEGDTTWYGRKFNTYNQIEFKSDTTESRNSIMIPFDFYQGDTISLDEPFAASVRCNSPLGREFNSEIMMFLAKENSNFNDDFSNEHEVKLDTFFNLNIDEENIKNFPEGTNKNYVVVFGRWFKTPGDKVLRGYMKEYWTKLDDDKDTLELERKVYFEKKIYVKDTLR